MERQSFHTGGWRTARWFWEKYMSKLKMKSWDMHAENMQVNPLPHGARAVQRLYVGRRSGSKVLSLQQEEQKG